jgi:lysyl-tRNA synthetase class 2
MDLNDLKTQSGLSGKQWDKGIKGLASHGLTKVTKTDEGLMVEIAT